MEDFRFEVSELPIKSVTVFNDRAEVSRVFKCSLEAGSNELSVYNLTDVCDPDSVRVEGRGKAVITEVSYSEKLQERSGEESSSDLTEAFIGKLRTEIKLLQSEKSRTEKKVAVLDGISDQIANGRFKSETDLLKIASSEQGLSGVTNFLEYYDNQSSKLDADLLRISDEIKSKEDKIRLLEQNLYEERWQHSTKVKSMRQVTISLDVQEKGEITLIISYLVGKAKWTPKYDVRAYVEDQAVRITYHGLIQQNTGEDWKNAKLFLSTASPSVGGDVPELPSKEVCFRRVEKLRKKVARSNELQMASATVFVNTLDVEDVPTEAAPIHATVMEEEEPQESMIDSSTTEVLKSGLSTSYEINKEATIPSDNTEHKVTVAIIDLKPQFEHITIPQKIENVFLKAKLVNESDYVILPGPTSVFVDNNFIGKASLPSVNVSEEFECSLGVDSAVRVEYLPCVQFDSSTSGILSKTQTTKYKQTIEVKNTHRDAIQLQVEDQLPRSRDNHIKVTLYSPTLNKEDPNCKAHKDKKGNIVWRSALAGQSIQTFNLLYTIERPGSSHELEFFEV